MGQDVHWEEFWLSFSWPSIFHFLSLKESVQMWELETYHGKNHPQLKAGPTRCQEERKSILFSSHKGLRCDDSMLGVRPHDLSLSLPCLRIRIGKPFKVIDFNQSFFHCHLSSTLPQAHLWSLVLTCMPPVIECSLAWEATMCLCGDGAGRRGKGERLLWLFKYSSSY